MRFRLYAAALAVAIVAAAAIVFVPGAGAEPKDEPTGREILPDYSEGLTGLLGPFLWSRAIDMGADARFCNERGYPDPNGRFLWLYQFMRHRRSKPKLPLLHERNNLVAADASLAFEVQPWELRLNCPRPHNFKLIHGYIQKDFHFQHGDNCDLAHLAGAGRVCVFMPIRLVRQNDPRPVTDQRRYMISPVYAAQSVAVVEWKAGEMIHYEWFRDPENLHERILFDLAPYFAGDKRVHPGISKPIFRFTIDGEGGWKLRIEREGRDGLAGGKSADSWDMTFTHESPGAKPYTVDLTRDNSAWAMSTFSPGGRPEETSEAIVALNPFDRDSGKKVPWPDRSRRIRSFPVERLPAVLQGKSPARVVRKDK